MCLSLQEAGILASSSRAVVVQVVGNRGVKKKSQETLLQPTTLDQPFHHDASPTLAITSVRWVERVLGRHMWSEGQQGSKKPQDLQLIHSAKPRDKGHHLPLHKMRRDLLPLVRKARKEATTPQVVRALLQISRQERLHSHAQMQGEAKPQDQHPKLGLLQKNQSLLERLQSQSSKTL